jgi:hypothetical protein
MCTSNAGRRLGKKRPTDGMRIYYAALITDPDAPYIPEKGNKPIAPVHLDVVHF